MPEEPFALSVHDPQPVPADYDDIHAAVMETARGRWFLKEYARRNRSADTTIVLAAIERIEAALRNQAAISESRRPEPSPPAPDAPPRRSAGTAPPSAHALHELRDAIMLTKDSLPAVDPEGRIAFKPDFNRIPSGVAAAADRMRASAEHVQETAWFLRERAEQEKGALKDALNARCHELETQARELTAACAQLDHLSESAGMIAALLTEIETRLDGMISAELAQADASPEPAVAKARFERPPATPAREEPAPSPVAPTPVRDEPPSPPRALVDIPPITTTVTERPPAAVMESEPSSAAAPPPPQREPMSLADMIDQAAARVSAPSAAEMPPPAPEPEPEIVAVAAPVHEPAPEVVAQAVPEIAITKAAPAPQPSPAIDWSLPPAPTAKPQPAPAAVEPQPAPAAGPRPQWMDALAPAVHSRHTPDPGPRTTVSFDFDDAPPTIAMPNPARREMPGSDLVPPPRPESPSPMPAENARTDIAGPEAAAADIAPTPLVPRIDVTPQAIAEPVAEPAPEPARDSEPIFRIPVPLPDEGPRNDLATFLFDQAPEPRAKPKPAPDMNGNGEHEKPAIPPAPTVKPADALAPIMALSDEEKIALFS